MCGIGGILTAKTEIIPKTLEKLNQLLHHRGPDGCGTWISSDGSVGFNHTRLSILDLSEAGHQPFASDDGRFWMTYNGEVYNYLELRSELENAGFDFKTHSDTEVVLKSYQHWGKDCFQKFNGMWALAIYDTFTKELLLSRDRYGVKPLYYADIAKTFAFASEIKALYAGVAYDWHFKPDVMAAISNGSFDYHGTTSTFVEEISSLPGGHLLRLKNNISTIERWYELQQKKHTGSYAEQTEELRTIFSDACRIRLRSDVEIGTCLSGGLDSGGITSLIATMGLTGETASGFKHRAFCVSFPQTQIDELDAALNLARQKNVKLSVLPVEAPTAVELEAALRSCDGPMHALAFYPIWKLYKHIKESGVSVTLDGQGPDEMLGGYRPLGESLLAARQLKRPLWYYDVYNTYAGQGEFPHFSSRTFARRAVYNDLKQAIKGQHSDIALRQGFAIPSVQFGNALDNSLYSQFFQSPLPGILNQYDRCSMANAVECRMPFMDYRLVEFIFSLPPEAKVGGGYTKRILREALSGIVPNSTRLNKIKIGFNAPMIEWFQEPSLKEWMLDTISSADNDMSQFFDMNKFRSDMDAFYKTEDKNWNQAWPLWPKVHMIWWMNNLKH